MKILYFMFSCDVSVNFVTSSYFQVIKVATQNKEAEMSSAVLIPMYKTTHDQILGRLLCRRIMLNHV